MNKLVVVILALSLSAAAQAGKTGAFFGGGYSFATVKADRVADFDMATLDIAGGLMFNEYLGFEARLGAGVRDDERQVDIGVQTVKVETSITRYYGLYLRPQFTLDQMQVYGLLGYAGTEVEMQIPNSPLLFDGDATGTSFGVGIGFSMDRALFFNLEYMNMMSADDYDFNGINLRVEFKL